MDHPTHDPDLERRLARLIKMLDRIKRRTERDAELTRALREAERVGAKAERERCAAWLESLECGDDGLSLLMQEVARVLRRGAVEEDP
ncbi:MAG: hypothetical protein H6837_09920 [Planctomycetes bacterium]|nr:hypothetical protein [Planctomycetota bacterium]